MRKCNTENLHALLTAIAEKRTLYLSTDGTDGRAHYTRMDENSILNDPEPGVSVKERKVNNA